MSGIRFFSFLSQLDPLTTKWFKGMNNAVPFEVKKIINDNLIKTCKSIIVNKANVFYFPVINNSNDSWRNIAKNDHHGTIEGAGLVFDSYFGFSNPNGTGYIDTHFNPSTQGNGKYTLNNAAIVVGLFDKKDLIRQNIIGCTEGGSANVGINTTTDSTYILEYLNGLAYTYTTLPFYNGLHLVNRALSTIINILNQNIIKSNPSNNSGSIPNNNIYVFNSNGSALPLYSGGINFIYIGASLTDAEFTTLNNAVNETLIQLLFYKFGKDNWGVKMAKSYFYDLHGFEKYEAWEVYEFIKRMQPDYTYTPVELSVNSGAEGLTDWVDSNSDGLADGWSVVACSTSIVTGNGFTGNAQRLVATAGSSTAFIYGLPTLYLGKSYTISGKYRSSKSWNITNISQIGTQNSFIANTGNAISFSHTFVVGGTAVPRLYVGANLGDWLEIDELSCKENTESDTVSFNKCTNSGFGTATDWINPTNGLAQGWSQSIGANQVNSIVTGNGFTGNAQRSERINSTGNIHIYPSTPALTIGRSYTIYCKYRACGTINVTRADTGANIGTIGTQNTGNAIIGSCTFVAVSNNIRIEMIGYAATAYFEVDEVCIIDNTNSQFLYNFFGTNGLNKTVCDYLMLFKAGGNLIANAWSKTGALLRWNQDGTVTNSNTMPAYTRGSNLGIVTVSSTDGFDLLIQVETYQNSASVNSFYGNFPNIVGILKKSGKLTLNARAGRFKNDLRNASIKDYVASCALTHISYPGYQKIDLSKFVGGSFDRIEIDNTYTVTDIQGDVTNFTFAPTLFYCYNNYNVYGSLRNLSTSRLSYGIYVPYTSITEGTSSWNKNANILNMAYCKLNTVSVDNQLSVIDNYFTGSVVPIKNLTVSLNGTGMGVPTGGVNNVNRLSIIAKHVAQSLVATINVNS